MKGKKIILLGAGGHAKVLLSAIKRMDYEDKNIKEVLVSSPDQPSGETVMGCRSVGGDRDVLNYKASEVLLVNGVGSLKNNKIRKELFMFFKDKGYTFLTVVDPWARLDSDVFLGEGAQVLMGAHLQPGVVVGENTIVNTGAQIDHDTTVGKHSHLAPRSVLCGDVKVGSDVFIGAGSVVIQGRAVGEAAVVGAGTLVYKNIDAGAFVRADDKL